MKIVSYVFVFILTFMILNNHAFTQGKDKTFIVGDGIRMTAEVIEVDKKKRKITLKGKEGKTQTIKLPKGVKGMDQIDVGDILDIEIIYSLAIQLAKPGELEGESVAKSVRYNKKGEKPRELIVETVDVVAKIKSLDLQTRTVTLVGDKGHTITLVADSSVKNFDTLKVGDEVHARYTEEFAIGFVEKQAR